MENCIIYKGLDINGNIITIIEHKNDSPVVGNILWDDSCVDEVILIDD